ncbi:MAG: hypothetical protein C0598_10045 [Marinilabiliales bacterium]|nr:MAG: hypothetical protein C0598_10045 [Marinilabiliales bacterium]
MLGFVLVSKSTRNRKTSYILLSAFIISNALVMIQFIIDLYGLLALPSIPIFYYLLAPLMYLYVRSLCEKKFKLKAKHLLHFLIFLIITVYFVLSLFFFENKSDANYWYYDFVIIQTILHLQIALYILASFISIFKYRIEIKNIFTAVEQINLTWLLVIIMAFTSMWFIDLVAFIITVVFSKYAGVTIYLIICSVSINLLFANYLVYKGLNQDNAFDGIKSPKKYSGSKINSEDSRLLVENLKKYMSDKKPYLNPNLTIKDLSEEFKIHQKFLSQIINSEIGKNFFDFVNYYRIQDAIELMKDNSNKKMTILEILYEVGFNSKSAFNSAFKKNIGKTPTEFKKTA